MVQVKNMKDLSAAKILWLMFAMMGILSSYGFATEKFEITVFAMAGLWFLNLLFCVLNFKERVLYFILQLTIGTFLIVRPLCQTIKGDKIWGIDTISKADCFLAVLIITLSLIGLYCGANMYYCLEKVFNKKNDLKKERAVNSKRDKFRIYLQIISMLAFYVTLIFFAIEGMEKVLFVREHTYLAYYSEFTSRLPGVFSTISSFMKYCLCLFLATFPSKKRASCALVFFEGSALFDLIIGIRGTIILNSIFIFAYYLIRDFKEDKEKWFGKIEKTIVILGTPLVLAFMMAYSNIRSGLRVLDTSVFKLSKDFFVAQGVTFEVVARGISVAEQLPDKAGKNYTFGPMIDYIVHGRVGQMLLKTEALPAGNNVVNGLESNNLSHNLSYLTLGENYLKGHGWGSSYVLENYIDFGLVGVVLFSIILGLMLISMVRCYGKHMLLNTIILVSLTNIFYIPRAESTGWLLFIITIQFWVCIGCCYFGAYIVNHFPLFEVVLKWLKLVPIEGGAITEKKANTQKEKYFIAILVVGVLIICGYSVVDGNKKDEIEGNIISNVQTPGAEYENRRVTLEVRIKKEGNYQYQFSELFEGSERVVQEYSENNVYAFITEEVGRHVFYIDIKSEEGSEEVLEYILNVKEAP